ncbi:MAG: ATP-binding protein, partial [Pseudonocardiaceae bacterium]
MDLTKPGTVVFGPSETGKSYVFQCITYCLGGDTLPEEIPEAQGYQSVFLELQAGPGSGMVEDEPDIQSSLGFDDPSPHSVDRDIFTVVRAIQGGSEAIYRAEIEAVPTARRLKIDCNELITRLVGVSENVVLKKAGTKGSLSAGPVRHWSLLSQTAIVARDNVLGDSNARTERSAALALMLTGVDDTAIETGVSTEEKRNAAGGADAIRGMITSLKADIPPETTKKDLDETLARVDETLAALSQQQKSRAQGLETVRGEIASASAQFRKCEGELAQSIGLVNRFKLLEQKYQSDLERLVSLSEGAAVYELLETLPCPLCGTNLEHHAKDSATSADSAKRQRRAFAAEAAKIEKQRSGLGAALLYESERLTFLKARRIDLEAALEGHSVRERRMIHSGIAEFEVSATDLARQR